MLTELTDSIELELNQSDFFVSTRQENELITVAATSVLQRYDRNLAIQYINQVYRSKPPLELIQQLSA